MEIFGKGITGFIHFLLQEAMVLLELVPGNASGREHWAQWGQLVLEAASNWRLFSGFFEQLLLLGSTAKK